MVSWPDTYSETEDGSRMRGDGGGRFQFLEGEVKLRGKLVDRKVL
jgi:hypothetical protein